ncbi:hypothetical protein BV22DRAFT_1052618 [Leucogyrophana mollusca]|uniref:Uncharacterized protein n=1 Tax=Leucogyrophana mollusca TaxID=85980 RepID=A0ACB8AVW5_9AGAM|nr:hypothetical protein BV22DRAFT_1052618 [Leucogyrophana mollusca]
MPTAIQNLPGPSFNPRTKDMLAGFTNSWIEHDDNGVSPDVQAMISKFAPTELPPELIELGWHRALQRKNATAQMLRALEAEHIAWRMRCPPRSLYDWTFHHRCTARTFSKSARMFPSRSLSVTGSNITLKSLPGAYSEREGGHGGGGGSEYNRGAFGVGGRGGGGDGGGGCEELRDGSGGGSEGGGGGGSGTGSDHEGGGDGGGEGANGGGGRDIGGGGDGGGLGSVGIGGGRDGGGGGGGEWDGGGAVGGGGGGGSEVGCGGCGRDSVRDVLQLVGEEIFAGWCGLTPSDIEMFAVLLAMTDDCVGALIELGPAEDDSECPFTEVLFGAWALG